VKPENDTDPQQNAAVRQARDLLTETEMTRFFTSIVDFNECE